MQRNHPRSMSAKTMESRRMERGNQGPRVRTFPLEEQRSKPRAMPTVVRGSFPSQAAPPVVYSAAEEVVEIEQESMEAETEIDADESVIATNVADNMQTVASKKTTVKSSAIVRCKKRCCYIFCCAGLCCFGFFVLYFTFDILQVFVSASSMLPNPPPFSPPPIPTLPPFLPPRLPPFSPPLPDVSTSSWDRLTNRRGDQAYFGTIALLPAKRTALHILLTLSSISIERHPELQVATESHNHLSIYSVYDTIGIDIILHDGLRHDVEVAPKVSPGSTLLLKLSVEDERTTFGFGTKVVNVSDVGNLASQDVVTTQRMHFRSSGPILQNYEPMFACSQYSTGTCSDVVIHNVSFTIA